MMIIIICLVFYVKMFIKTVGNYSQCFDRFDINHLHTNTEECIKLLYNVN